MSRRQKQLSAPIGELVGGVRYPQVLSLHPQSVGVYLETRPRHTSLRV